MRGRPAFGWHISGRFVTFATRAKRGSISRPPRPQFRPSAVTRRLSSSTAMVSTEPPVSSLPSASAVMVAKTGRSQASCAPSTAAFIS